MNQAPKVVLGKFVALTLLLVTAQGCLQTRDTNKEVEEKQVFKKQLTTLQQSTADVNSRFQDIEEDQRKVAGRLEAVEVRLQQTAQKSEKADKAVDAKLEKKDEVYREEFAKLNNDVAALKQQLATMQEESRKAAEAHAQAESRAQAEANSRAENAAKNPFSTAEELFEKKSWKEAILSYEKYRSHSPKGKSFAVATYKIGVCFQELGMLEESKAFYDEVITKFPKSKEADKASSRLKAMNKKKK